MIIMPTMQEIAQLVVKYDAELRQGLQVGRTGLFRTKNDKYIVQSNIPLGGRYENETIMIFADESDLELFYKTYLPTD